MLILVENDLLIVNLYYSNDFSPEDNAVIKQYGRLCGEKMSVCGHISPSTKLLWILLCFDATVQHKENKLSHKVIILRYIWFKWHNKPLIKHSNDSEMINFINFIVRDRLYSDFAEIVFVYNLLGHSTVSQQCVQPFHLHHKDIEYAFTSIQLWPYI